MTHQRPQATRLHEPDADLVEAAINGDSQAFDALYRRYHSLVYGIVRADARGTADTDDITQEVFAQAWTRLSSLRDTSLFRSWLTQITRRTIIDHYRHGARRPPLRNDDDLALGALPSPADSPDEIAQLRELARTVEGGINDLSPRDATVVSLAVHFGFGPTDIGEALGITPGNAKVVLHRARKRLRDSIDAAPHTSRPPKQTG